MGGHVGILRMIKQIRITFKWNRIDKDIGDYVKKCTKCQYNKINRKPLKNPILITSTSKKTFGRVALDIVGLFNQLRKIINIYYQCRTI